jgi:hypothetical protein
MHSVAACASPSSRDHPIAHRPCFVHLNARWALYIPSMDWTFLSLPAVVLDGALAVQRGPINTLQNLCLEVLVIRARPPESPALTECIIRSSWRRLAPGLAILLDVGPAHDFNKILPLLGKYSTPVFIADVCGYSWMIKRLLVDYDRYDILPYVRHQHQDIVRQCLGYWPKIRVLDRLRDLGIHPDRGVQQFGLLFGSSESRAWIRANYRAGSFS